MMKNLLLPLILTLACVGCMPQADEMVLTVDYRHSSPVMGLAKVHRGASGYEIPAGAQGRYLDGRLVELAYGLNR